MTEGTFNVAVFIRLSNTVSFSIFLQNHICWFLYAFRLYVFVCGFDYRMFYVYTFLDSHLVIVYSLEIHFFQSIELTNSYSLGRFWCWGTNAYFLSQEISRYYLLKHVFIQDIHRKLYPESIQAVMETPEFIWHTASHWYFIDLYLVSGWMSSNVVTYLIAPRCGIYNLHAWFRAMLIMLYPMLRWYRLIITLVVV